MREVLTFTEDDDGFKMTEKGRNGFSVHGKTIPELFENAGRYYAEVHALTVALRAKMEDQKHEGPAPL